MRHGRKSRDRLIDGYKRHVPRDLDQGLVRGAPACGSGLSVAHAPEATVTKSIVADLAAQEATLSELYIDDEQIKGLERTLDELATLSTADTRRLPSPHTVERAQ